MTQPDWITPDFVATLRNVSKVANEFVYGISKPYVPEMIKLRGGRCSSPAPDAGFQISTHFLNLRFPLNLLLGSILKALIDTFQHKLSCMNRTTEPECLWMGRLKYFAYSAVSILDVWTLTAFLFQHDTTVAALLTTFGDEERVIRGGLPHYTASVALELWNLEGVGPALRILFHSAFHHKYHVITNFTKGCPLDSDYCPLETFIKRSKKFIPDDIKKDCRPKNENSTKAKLNLKIRNKNWRFFLILLYWIDFPR